MLADLRSGSLSRSGDETSLAEPRSRLLRERTAPAAVTTTQLCCDAERFGAERLRERVSDLLQKHASTASVLLMLAGGSRSRSGSARHADRSAV